LSWIIHVTPPPSHNTNLEQNDYKFTTFLVICYYVLIHCHIISKNYIIHIFLKNHILKIFETELSLKVDKKFFFPVLIFCLNILLHLKCIKLFALNMFLCCLTKVLFSLDSKKGGDKMVLTGVDTVSQRTCHMVVSSLWC
jgi:hypothetical protein